MQVFVKHEWNTVIEIILRIVIKYFNLMKVMMKIGDNLQFYLHEVRGDQHLTCLLSVQMHSTFCSTGHGTVINKEHGILNLLRKSQKLWQDIK